MKPFAAVAGIAACAYSLVPAIATGEHGAAVWIVPIIVGLAAAALVDRTAGWVVGTRRVQYRPQVRDAGVAILTRSTLDEHWATLPDGVKDGAA